MYCPRIIVNKSPDIIYFLQVLESLLAKHDKSKFISLKDESHRSPLHLSAISGLVSNVEALGRVMHGLNERDDHGHTPLHTAAMNGNRYNRIANCTTESGTENNSVT